MLGAMPRHCIYFRVVALNVSQYFILYAQMTRRKPGGFFQIVPFKRTSMCVARSQYKQDFAVCVALVSGRLPVFSSHLRVLTNKAVRKTRTSWDAQADASQR
jgi:hypothetical protein